MYITALEPLEKVAIAKILPSQQDKKSNEKIRQEITGQNVKINTLNIKLINNKIRQHGQREIIQQKVLKHHTKRKTPNSKTKIKIGIKVEETCHKKKGIICE